MKYLLIFLLLTGCVAGLHAQQGLFDTYRGWDDLLQKARASDRNIFLYFGAKWCAPCHTLMEKVFPADTVKIKMNSLFVSFAFDADSTNATAFLKKYRITNMPVFLILDRNGFLLNRTETVEPTIPGFLARIDKKNWNALEYKGISNRLEMPWPAFYNEYFQTKMKTLPDSAVVDNYLRKQKDLTSEVNWDVLSLFNVSDDLFTNLIRAKDSFKAKYGMEASFKIVNMYKRIAQHYMATQDSVNYNRITLLLTQPKDNRDSAAWNAFYVRQLQFLGITGMDWDKFISITKMVRQRYGTKNDEFIVQYAYASKLNDQTAEYLMGMLDTLLISRPLAGNYLMYSILWLQRHDQEKARYYLDKAVTASATKEAKDRCRMEFERLQNKMSI